MAFYDRKNVCQEATLSSADSNCGNVNVSPIRTMFLYYVSREIFSCQRSRDFNHPTFSYFLLREFSSVYRFFPAESLDKEKNWDKFNFVNTKCVFKS